MLFINYQNVNKSLRQDKNRPAVFAFLFQFGIILELLTVNSSVFSTPFLSTTNVTVSQALTFNIKSRLCILIMS